jgi:two-component system, LytTR family, response regulator
MIRTLIVDDERLAIKRMRQLLLAHRHVQIIGEAQDLHTAAAFAAREQPDLVFLDIQLAPGFGFDLIPRLPLATSVVFVTAYDNRAIRAFEAGAVDYLLKPVFPARLAATMERLQRTLLRSEPHVLVGDSRNWIKLPAQDITAIVAEGVYTRIYTTNTGSHLVRRTMHEWLQVLPEGRFFRADRSLIVNREKIARLRCKNRDKGELLLEGCPAPLQLGRIAIRTLRHLGM